MEPSRKEGRLVLWFEDIGKPDVPLVGGKNANLGELQSRVNVPTLPGFCITTRAYRHFIEYAGLKGFIEESLSGLDTHDMRDLARRGALIRKRISSARMSRELEDEIRKAYHIMGRVLGQRDPYVAVRSSATAEDVETASFAGQQDTYLNVHGGRDLIRKTKKCFASLFTNRAISYRQDKGFDHFSVALSIGVQKMGRSDLGCAGVMFTIDPDSGFRNVVVINGSYGLGEYVVQGKVIPDEWVVFKPTKGILEKVMGDKSVKLVRGRRGNVERKVPEAARGRMCLSDRQALELAEYGLRIEKHYGRPMDIEWALDGGNGKLYITQARPETVHSTRSATVFEEYVLKGKSEVLLSGMAIGKKIGAGRANVLLNSKDINKFSKGEVLVTTMTDPDWEPIMKIASAIITEEGGRTCFSGDTRILTDRGFLRFRDVHERVCAGERFLVLSYDYENRRPEWKMILSSQKNRLPAIRVSISQTGNTENNFLDVTADHRFYTYENRRLVKKPLNEMLLQEEAACLVDDLPQLVRRTCGPEGIKLAYLLGALATDGSIYLCPGVKKMRRGQVTFTQKRTPAKEDFISTVNDYFTDVFGKPLTPRDKFSVSHIEGRTVSGLATDFRCYSLQVASRLDQMLKGLPALSLSFTQEEALSFLAGAIDGDGSFHNNRIQIYASKENVLQAIVTSCLRLGIVPQVTTNRNIFNVQIVERMEDILLRSRKIKAIPHEKMLGTRLLAARQVLGDVIDHVNYKGGIRPYVENNLLIDARKIRDRVLPLADSKLKDELNDVLDSSLRMQRIGLVRRLSEIDVFNVEVEADNEMGHNYVVFTSRLTPLLVSNSHAAIVSRELGVPCVIGTKHATKTLKAGQPVTVDCSTGKGRVYKGILNFSVEKRDIGRLPKTRTQVMVNIGEPDEVLGLAALPVQGIGLAREEFIVNSYVGAHPLQLVREGREKKYVNTLASGIGKIVAAFHPRPVIVRLSDFKSDEYANLRGGKEFEPHEDNPMIGWRGASRYYDKEFAPAFEMECRALRMVWKDMGLRNMIIMVPFCRTPEEGRKVLERLAAHGLSRKEGCRFYVMAEIPSNIILADRFSKLFDGFSIGSNDLTQLTLGLDRNSERLDYLFDERDEAVKRSVSELIRVAHKYRRKVGICGQAPSDFPDFCEFLVKEGIDSISVNPDVAIKTILLVDRVERKLRGRG
jgi:pyruvate,water dikinase